ncbi:MAG: hypothetical protein ACRD1R_04345 [Acidobacteriota bacterium]
MPITTNSVISEVIDETYDTVTLCLDVQDPIPHIPGQSIGIDPKQFEPLQGRVQLVETIAKEKNCRALTAMKLYSLANSSLDFRKLYITIKVEEDREGYPPSLLSPYAVKDMGSGEAMIVKGPYGKKFLFQPKEGDRFVFWGAGSGVVPLMYFLEHVDGQGLSNEILFFDSNKTPEDIIYNTRLKAIESENSNIRIVHSITRPETSSRQWLGRVGRLVQLRDPNDLESLEFPSDIDAYSKEIPFEDAYHYICGSLGFGQGIKKALLNRAVDKDRIYLEAWG